jgi:diacylglycerol O-acyltransferase
MARTVRFAERLSDIDALLWMLEADPYLRSGITVVIELDRSPGQPRLEERMERASRTLARLRQRAVGGPGGWLLPRWEEDPSFDVGYHVRAQGLPGGRRHGLDGVLEVAEPLVVDGFDPARPPWRMVLVEGLAGGRAALVVRLHHSISDGVGLIRLALALFDFERDAATAAPLPLPPATTVSEWQRALSEVDHELRRGLSLLRRAVPELAGAMVALGQGGTQAVPLAGALADFLEGRAAPRSPILRGRSMGVRLAALSFPLDDWRQAGKRLGGTINDVFLAGVAGGMEHYHRRHGSRPATLRVGLAINVRSEDSADVVGNLFAPVAVEVPLREGPAARVAEIHRRVGEQRDGLQPGLIAATAYGMRRLPPGALVPLVRQMVGSVDLAASNVPGSPDPLYLEGARVLGMIPFGPRVGLPLNLTLLSLEQTLHLGVNLDPAAVPDHDVLIESLRQGFEELTA